MSIADLKELLTEILDNLDEYEDNQEVDVYENTYWLNGAKYFLGISGYNGGYINLSSPLETEDEEEDY